MSHLYHAKGKELSIRLHGGMRNEKKLISTMLLAIILAACAAPNAPAATLTPLPPTPVHTSTPAGDKVSCGQVIRKNTVLAEDLVCPPGTENALKVEMSNITLDLGGHTISGHAPGHGILVEGRKGVTIKNGTIEGFQDGIIVLNSRNVTIEDMTVKNLVSNDPDFFVVGVHVDSSLDVVLRNSRFEFLSVAHKEGVQVYGSSMLIEKIEVYGGGAGVGFSYAGICDHEGAPNTGIVRNSRFVNIYIAGFYIACTNNLLIEGNDISTYPGEGVGIQTEPPVSGGVTGLVIRDNEIHETVIGIEFRGTVDSTVTKNEIYSNSAYGIWIRKSLGCIEPMTDRLCFNSSGNMIVENDVWGNGTDLFADCPGSTWQNNICSTKLGKEIPDCK